MWGIVILIIFSIGLASILIWVGKFLVRIYRKHFSHQNVRDWQQVSFVGNNIPQDVPVIKATSSSKGFFMPRYRDVIVPDKHNIATVVEFENSLTQWIYDVMAGVKRFNRDCKPTIIERVCIWLAVVFAGIMTLAGNPLLLACIVACVVYIVLVDCPMGSRAARDSAIKLKSLTPDDWRKVYQDIQESENRANEIATAIRRSGVVRRHW